MTSEEFQRLRQTFEKVLAAPPHERTVILRELSGSVPALADELQRMLVARSKFDSLLDQPLVGPAIAEPLPRQTALDRESGPTCSKRNWAGVEWA